MAHISGYRPLRHATAGTLLASLLCATALAACVSRGDDAVAGDEADVTTESWQSARAVREAALTSFFATQREELHAFRDAPLGSTGLPLVLFKLLPDVMPDLWGPGWVEEVGLFDAPKDDPVATPRETLGLPYGLGWTASSKPLIDVPLLDNVRMQVVNLTCGACHTGRVVDDAGKTHYVIGAPSTTFVSGAWRYKLTKTVNDPRWNAPAFVEAMNGKPSGWLYPPLALRAQELVDTRVLREKGAQILATVKERVNRRETLLQEYVGKRTYKELAHMLNGGTPGQVEAFGIAVSLLIPPEIASLEGTAKEDALRGYLPPAPAFVDIMSVWNQKDRRAAQWDGNIEAPLLRNLGAELGVIGDPTLTSLPNAVATTRFVRDLPAAPYPFQVDTRKLALGKEVYATACASCHDGGGGLYPLALVGTDPNRAKGLTAQSRKALATAILATCTDRSDPACQVPEDRVVIDRQGSAGYLASPLDGIWARAPYMHNGAIPTLEQVLVPSKRATTFFRGNLTYDRAGVGFTWDRAASPRATAFDTRTNGLSNQGHADPDVFSGGIDFEKDVAKREALLEYLKTL